MGMLISQLVVMWGFGLGLIVILNVRFALQSLACTFHCYSVGFLSCTAGILQYISIQFEILTNQEAPITGIHCKMPTVSQPCAVYYLSKW